MGEGDEDAEVPPEVPESLQDLGDQEVPEVSQALIADAAPGEDEGEDGSLPPRPGSMGSSSHAGAESQLSQPSRVRPDPEDGGEEDSVDQQNADEDEDDSEGAPKRSAPPDKNHKPLGGHHKNLEMKNNNNIQWFVFAPPGPRMKMDMEFENVEPGYEPENFERHERRGIGTGNRPLTLPNVLKHVCRRLHLLDNISEDVEVLMRPKFPKPDHLQLMQARMLLPEHLLQKVVSHENSFDEVLENTKPRLLLDPVFDRLDAQLQREGLCRQLLECVCCFLPLEHDPDNSNPKTVKHNLEALKRGDMDPGYDPIAEEKEAFLKKELERRAFAEEKKRKEREKKEAEAAARRTAKSAKQAAKVDGAPGSAQGGKKAGAGAKKKAAAKSGKSSANVGGATTSGGPGGGASGDTKESKAERERKKAEEAEKARLALEEEERQKKAEEDARIARERAEWEAFNRPNRFHEEAKKEQNYNTVIQNRILPMWRCMKEPETALQLCKLCSLLHKIDNEPIKRFLLNCPRSSYAWLALAKCDTFMAEALELACDVMVKGAGTKPSLDRAVGFFVGRHIATCGSVKTSESADALGSSLISLPLARKMCQSLLFALAQKMKKLYRIGADEHHPAQGQTDALGADEDARAVGGTNIMSAVDVEAEIVVMSGVESRHDAAVLLGQEEPVVYATREERKAAEALLKQEKEDTAAIQTYCCALFLLLRQSVFDDYNDAETTGDFIRDEQYVKDQIVKIATRKLELMPMPEGAAAAEQEAAAPPPPVVAAKTGKAGKSPSPKKGGGAAGASPKRGTPAKKKNQEKPLEKGKAWVERRHQPRLCRVHSLLEVCMAHHAAALLVPYLQANAGIPMLLTGMLEEATVDMQMHMLSFGLLDKIVDAFEANPGRGLLLSTLCRLTAALMVQDRRKDVWRSSGRFKKKISHLIFDAIEKYAHELKAYGRTSNALAIFGLLALASLFENAKICFQAAAYVMRLYPQDRTLQLASWACLLNAADYIYKMYPVNRNLNSMHIQKRYLDPDPEEATKAASGEDGGSKKSDGEEDVTTQRQLDGSDEGRTGEDEENVAGEGAAARHGETNVQQFDEDGNAIDIAPQTPLGSGDGGADNSSAMGEQANPNEAATSSGEPRATTSASDTQTASKPPTAGGGAVNGAVAGSSSTKKAVSFGGDNASVDPPSTDLGGQTLTVEPTSTQQMVLGEDNGAGASSLPQVTGSAHTETVGSSGGGGEGSSSMKTGAPISPGGDDDQLGGESAEAAGERTATTFRDESSFPDATAGGSSSATAPGGAVVEEDGNNLTNLEPLPGGTTEEDGAGGSATKDSASASSASSEPKERPFEIIDAQEERIEAAHYEVIMEMARCVLSWLQKDDPHYIEVEKDNSELLCQQYESDCNIKGMMSEYKRLEKLKTVLAEERLKQWHPPVTKYPSVQEVYYKRLLKVHGEDDEEVGPSARAEREITALIRRWPPHKLHVMYLEQCAKFTVPEEEIESEYVPPPPPPPQYTRPIPKNRTVQWEYRKRMIDLYTRKGHLVRAENVDIEMLDYRGREHLLYRRRCQEFEEHPLPVYRNKGADVEEAKPQPVLCVDDVEVQFLGLSVMELLVTSTNRHDISVELRRIGERGVDHPVVLIDLASRSFMAVFNEAQNRLDRQERARKHAEEIERYCMMIRRLRDEYGDIEEQPAEDAGEGEMDGEQAPKDEDARIRALFDDCPQGEAREVFVKECRKFNVDPDDFEEAIDEEDEESSEDEDEQEDEDAAE